MGQKVHPEGFRVGYIHDWKSNWFNEREFSSYLLEDLAIRDHIEERLSHAGLSDIEIRKQRGEVTVDIHTARPGIVIGKSGAEVDSLRRDLHKLTNKPVRVNIREIKRPELDAKLVAQSIAEQLQNRVAFRRAMKRALTSAMRSGAEGVKVQVSGRLGGADMARTQGYSDGRVPLHTLRADIDYGFIEAKTTTGRIGVKCWINKGEVMPEGFRSTDGERDDGPPGRSGGRGSRDGGGGPRRDSQGSRRPPRGSDSKPPARGSDSKPPPAKPAQAKPAKPAAQTPAEPAAPKPPRADEPSPPPPPPSAEPPQASEPPKGDGSAEGAEAKPADESAAAQVAEPTVPSPDPAPAESTEQGEGGPAPGEAQGAPAAGDGTSEEGQS